MNQPIDFDLIQRKQALDSWIADCRRRMSQRFPRIDFDSENWPIRTTYQTPQKDWYFTSFITDFAAKDASYIDVLRCLVSEIVLAGKPKEISISLAAFRLLASTSANQIFNLTLQDLQGIQSNLLISAKNNPSSASRAASKLYQLTLLPQKLATKGVLPRLGFHHLANVKAQFRELCKTHDKTRRDGHGDILNRKMEAFNEVLNALVDNDVRLNPSDRVAIAATTRELCAPSRINEILCSSIDDHATVEEYAHKPFGTLDGTHRSHQMLLVMMKGSKGAQWSAKPVLDFMIDAFHYTTQVILEHGKRSRMLVAWYQKNPSTLYLPPELEYLRGNDISRITLGKIINLTETPLGEAHKSAAKHCFLELNNRVFKGPNPNSQTKCGKINPRGTVSYLRWDDVEELLLRKVNQALANCRKVTTGNHYQGNLSKMLFLFDRDETPYLPSACTYEILATRLKQSGNSKRIRIHDHTIFEKLNICMPINGKVQIAEIEFHDPRRWLTTMAQLHGDNLSDVLINKWASRCRLSQLKSYDFRTAADIAEFSKMPDATKLNELTDLSNALVVTQKLEDEFGLKTAIISAHNAGISMTSMDLVVQAIENRPVAKSSRGIIILYPQRFGICFHQHHEKPCRNYSNSLEASCTTCSEGAYIKGHLPTNDETRKVATQLFTSVLRQLKTLAQTHNRGIADEQDTLSEHILTLAKRAATLQDVAIYLIEEFHQIKFLIKDKMLARRLETAFVTREVVKMLDDPTRPSGAIIRYINPTQHADPLLEVALNQHGGREKVALDEKRIVEEFPEFSPKTLHIKDERHLVEPDDTKEDD